MNLNSERYKTFKMFWICSIFLGLFLSFTVQVFSEEYKMLIIDSEMGEPYKSARESMLASLEEKGYIPGENLKIKYYSIENNEKKGEEIITQELVNSYDVIFLNGTIAAISGKNADTGKTKDIFVFCCVTDPVGLGLIDDFKSSPKNNFTGVSYPVSPEARLRFIKDLMPDIKKIGLIYSDMPQSHSYRNWLDNAVKNVPGLEEITIICRMVPYVPCGENEEKIKESLSRFVRELDPEVDAFLSPNDQMGIKEYFPRIIYEEGSKPLIGLIKEDVMEKRGATMVIYPSHVSMGTQAANMIVKIFEGYELEDIIPEQPRESGFAFDLEKTKQFNIKVPIKYLKAAGENIIK